MYCFVLFEGAAAGCCIVTSDLDVFKMMITDHVSGILTPAGDSTEMAKALSEVLQNKGLQHRLMCGAQSRIPFLSWPEVAGQTENLYSSLREEEKDRTKPKNNPK
jgi:glycosyltransferase involved in cell wall biosynthesis